MSSVHHVRPSRPLTRCAAHLLQKRHAEASDPRTAPPQSAASTPASSSATFARGPLAAGVKEESDPPSADGDGAGAVVTSACQAGVGAGADRESDSGVITRTIGLTDGTAVTLAPGFVPVPPPRGAALAASGTVARMAAAETADGAPHSPVLLGIPISGCRMHQCRRCTGADTAVFTTEHIACVQQSL